jgi:hypothetical protein
MGNLRQTVANALAVLSALALLGVAWSAFQAHARHYAVPPLPDRLPGT